MSSFDTNEPGKRISNFADESMFEAQKIEKHEPEVFLISCNNDPLGTIAATAGAYQGKFYESLSDITDEDRRYYITDMEKNVLGMPSEAVQLHFVIRGVTRAFTHQLVRQRVGASYAQESMRFAVKDDFPVALPPSLAGTTGTERRDLEQEYLDQFERETGLGDEWVAADWAANHLSNKAKMRERWDEVVNFTKDGYHDLIEMGMPAEDARGLAPTNIMTQVNYVTTLRGLMDHAGLRLCTQAQFEWKQVWAKILEAIRAYGYDKTYRAKLTQEECAKLGVMYEKDGGFGYNSSQWQFDLLADRFKPVCYRTGKCEFMSDFDRYCPIRERVQANHKIGRPSKEWGEPQTFEETIHDGGKLTHQQTFIGIPAIRTEEWLDPFAAIKKDGEWRTEEQKQNIKNRRL